MDNNQNPGNPNQDSNRLQLKKVKRPINRMAPQSPAVPNVGGTPPAQNLGQSQQNSVIPNVNNNPFIQQNRSAVPQPQVQNPSRIEVPEVNKQQNFSEDAFNLDSYLDGDDNLPAINQPANQRPQPQFIEDENEVPEYEYNNSGLPPYLTKKVLIMLGALFFFVGILTSKVLFTEQKIVRNGLQGVVINPEVPRGRARCGVAEKTQGCVLYLMNPQRQELNARDFYDLASQLTGRQRFVIETGNMRYSNTKIRPGDIAQLNIPPL